MFKRLAVTLAASFACSLPARAEPPPASAFGRIPAVVEAAISPDGKRVALLSGAANQRVISIATLDQPGLPALALGDVEGVGVQWVGNDHVLARLAVWQRLDGHHAYRFERFISVGVNGKYESTLLQQDPDSAWLTGNPILGTSDLPPRALVLGLAESGGPSGTMDTRIPRKGVDNPFVRALISVDPANGRQSLVERGTFDTIAWEADDHGQARVRLEYNPQTAEFTVMGRARGALRYQRVWGGPARSIDDYYGYSAAEDAIYVSDNGRLTRIRLADGRPEQVSAVEKFVVWDRARHTAVGFDDGADVQWSDPEIAAVAASLGKVFPNQRVELKNWSLDRSRFVVRATAQGSPAVWYLFDKPRKELSPVGEEYPELKGAAFGPTRWITYKARDGLEIPAYVTLPPGAPEKGKLPLIVLPHGGPAARDDDDFDWLTQYLATRGYVVLRPQFRGSAGFGAAFEAAGNGEWGGKMQTDLLDGVATLAAQGLIDPKRVCIVGASFGGYAALAGAALHSEAYRCAASFAGVSSLGMLLVETGRLYGTDGGAVRVWRERLGGASPAQLEAFSPIRQIGRIRIPVLLMHGDKDTVVDPEQTISMDEAMRAAGKPVETLILPDENHYLTRSQTRTAMLQKLGDFLATNLPVTP